MFSAPHHLKSLATAMIVVALALVLPVSGASAHYGAQPASSSEVAPPASSIAASATDEYQNLRAAAQQPVVAEPTESSEPSGFDLVSAAIGAAIAGGLSLVLMATLTTRRAASRRPASA
jgi:hypothetical protein